MPFAFLIVGIVLVIAGVRGSSQDLVTLLKGDLTGQKNYFYWMIAIIAIGAAGYVQPIRPLSRAFLALVLIVLILENGGFFQLFDESVSFISKGNTTNS